jgi:hypothetical protein
MAKNKIVCLACGAPVKIVEEVLGDFHIPVHEDGNPDWDNKEFIGDSSMWAECTVCKKQYDYEMEDDIIIKLEE